MSQQLAPEYQDTPVVLVSPQLMGFFWRHLFGVKSGGGLGISKRVGTAL